MKRKSDLLTVLIGITIQWLGITFSLVSDDIPLAKVPSDVLKSIDDAKQRISACCKKYNYDASFLKNPYTGARFFTEVTYQLPIYEVYSNQQYKFDVLTTGQIISFWNDSPGRVAWNNIGSAPTQPIWTLPQASTISRDFLQAVLGMIPAELSNQPGGKCDQRELTSNKYLPQRWWIFWPRIAKDGYRFESDIATVSIYEKEGMAFAGIQFGTRFSEASFKPVSKDEALPFAIAASKKMAQWEPTSAIFGTGPVSETPTRVYLKIIKPDHWGDPKITSIYAPSDPHGRLAWEFVFPCYITDEEQKTHKFHHSVAVYIDAQTKEWLGGDIL
jgi:hypothetical protein